MASFSFHECSKCRALFREKSELTVHLKNSPACSSTPKKHDPHAFTHEARGSRSLTTVVCSETVPDTVISHKTRSSKTVHYGRTETLEDATLIAAMEAGLEKKPKPKTSGLETSILSTIAEGDDELVRAYSKISLDPTTGKRRLTKEIVASVTHKAKINIDRVSRMVSRAQNVSICFVLDTTGSMSSYIAGVKEQIVDIVQRVEASGCGIEGLAFVGYKDWCDGINHFEILPFTKSVADFKTFVASIYASGGGDFPEDVIGGLDKAVTLPWPDRSGTRLIFHLGDAPPHGKDRYHKHADDYVSGHPSDRPLQELFGEMCRKELLYYFGRINGECDKMVSVFETYYGQKIDKLDSTKASTICTAVTESVMKSVAVTCHSVSRAPSTMSGKGTRKFTLEEKEPEWSGLPRLQGTILSFDLPESIKVITSFAKLEDSVKRCRLQIAPNPFAKGSVRLAYYGKLFYSSKEKGSSLSTGEKAEDVVFKEMISLPAVADLDRQRYMTDLELQTISAKLAFEFNGKISRTSANPNIRMKFLMAKVVRIVKTEDKSVSSPRFLVYEKKLNDSLKFIKYTNNMDFVLDAKTLDENGRKRLELAVAFSHFTHDITGGYLLVCDLQGVATVNNKGKDTLLLTDPAIHCAKHLRFGKTNFGALGIKKFFERHVCNKYCKSLGLVIPTK